MRKLCVSLKQCHANGQHEKFEQSLGSTSCIGGTLRSQANFGQQWPEPHLEICLAKKYRLVYLLDQFESKNDISASIRIAICDNMKSKLINVVFKTSRTWSSGVPRFSFAELSNATYRVRPEELPDQSQMFKSMSEISAPQSVGINITKETYPSWLKGTLLRNGPGLMEFGQERVGSLADSLPMIRRYHIEGQQASSSLVISLIFFCLHFNNLLCPERN